MGGACSDVEQTFIEVGKFSKREQLLDLVKTCGTFLFLVFLAYSCHRQISPIQSNVAGNERTIVFVEKKRQADFIATFLCQENVPTTSIHGYVTCSTLVQQLLWTCIGVIIFYFVLQGP